MPGRKRALPTYVPDRKFSDIESSIHPVALEPLKKKMKAICGCHTHCDGFPQEVYTDTYTWHMVSERKHIEKTNPQDPRLRLPDHVTGPLADLVREEERKSLASKDTQPPVSDAQSSRKEPSPAEDVPAPIRDQTMDLIEQPMIGTDDLMLGADDPPWADNEPMPEPEAAPDSLNEQPDDPIVAATSVPYTSQDNPPSSVQPSVGTANLHQEPTSHIAFLEDAFASESDELPGMEEYGTTLNIASVPVHSAEEIVIDSNEDQSWFPYQRLNPRLIPPRQARQRGVSEIPFLQRSIYTMAVHLAASFNAPVKAVNHYLQSEWTHAEHAFNMGVKWARDHASPTRFCSSCSCESCAAQVAEPSEPPIVYDSIFIKPMAQTLRTAEKHLGIQSDIITNPVCPNKECHQVFYQITSKEEFCDVPMSCPACEEQLKTEDGEDLFLIYPRNSLTEELQRVVSLDGVWDLLTKTSQFQEVELVQDRRDYPDVKIYRNQFDGTVFAENEKWANDNKSDSDATVLHLNIGYDCYNPNSMTTSAAQSVGILCAQLANLPQRMRSNISLLMVLGVTPAPNEPRGANLWKHMLPLVSQVEDTIRHPITLFPPGIRDGVKVVVVIDALSCDRPAAISMVGAAHQSNKEGFCTRCHAAMSELKERRCFPRRDFRKERKAVHDQITGADAALAAEIARHDASEDARISQRNEQIREHLRIHGPRPASKVPKILNRQPFSKADRKAFMAHHFKFRGNVTAFSILPYFDGVTSATFDPFHLLLIGINKSYHQYTLTDGKYESAEQFERREVVPPGNQSKADSQVFKAKDRAELHRLMKQITWPAAIPPLANDFLSPSAGTGTGAHWKVYAELVTPLVYPVLFATRGVTSQELNSRDPAHDNRRAKSDQNTKMNLSELELAMTLSHLTTLALRPTVSSVQLSILEQKIEKFVKLALELHPGMVALFNLHSMVHVPEDIRAFGPARSYWTAVTERLNRQMKSQNSNGRKGQAEVLNLNAFLRGANVSGLFDQLRGSAAGEAELRKVYEELEAVRQKFIPRQSTIQVANLSEQLQIDMQMLTEDHRVFGTSRAAMSYNLSGESGNRPLDSILLEAIVNAAKKYWNMSARRFNDTRPCTSSTYLIDHDQIKMQTTVSCDRRQFSALQEDPGPSTSISFLKRHKQSMFYILEDKHIFQGLECKGSAFILLNVLTVPFKPYDNTRETLVYEFASMRPLREYTSGDTPNDPYGWKSDWKAANVKMYHKDALGPAQLIPMLPKIVQEWRPVIWIEIPVNPRVPSDNTLAIALKPVDNF